MQGAHAVFHKRLMRGRFVPTTNYLKVLARDVGVDPSRLFSDMNSETVSRKLSNTETIATIFGFVGTPVLVVGRTVVVGLVSQTVLAALIDRERREGPPPVCSATLSR